MSGPPTMTSPPSARSEKAPHAHVAPPKQRVFLPQSRRERFARTVWAALRPILFRYTPRSFNGLRIFILRRFGAEIGRDCFVHPSARIDFPWNLSLGDECVVEHCVILNCMGRVQIGPRCRISQYAHLCAGTHDYEDPAMPIVRRPITIGADVWIAADAFVGPGVTIGDGSLLAARSSAFGALAAGQVCIGEPAKPRKPRF